MLLGVPVAAVALATAAWGVDTASGADVVRNVELGGEVDVGGTEQEELRAAVEAYAAELAERRVRLVTPTDEFETTTADLGLRVDVDATVERVLDAGRDPAVLRPLRWLTSFVAPHQVDPVLRSDVDTAYHTIIGLEGELRVPPVEPSMALEDGGLVLVPGVPGSGIDVGAVSARLPEAVLDGDDPVVLAATPVPLPPAVDDATIAAAVEEANLITDVPLRVSVGDVDAEVSPGDQRAWLRLGPDGDVGVDEEAALADLADRMPELGEPPVDATVTLDGGRPVVVPGRDGTGCCEPGSGTVLLDAMRSGLGAARLEATPREPEVTTDEAEEWAIREPVGGARAWPTSRSGEVGPGFTTFHACCEARVTNIHRIADLVRGAVIPPGGEFSVNEHVGRRTAANGFVGAGAIRNGEHVTEIGGGVSQFATTLFNAAYFAGLDIVEYQAHSEYFSRYPRGREATMGYPAPDLRIENSTPFGVLIWTSYTETSLTVTLYSSPFVQAEQTDSRESAAGACTVVVTERTRTYPDGTVRTDEFRATYRPGEGRFC